MKIQLVLAACTRVRKIIETLLDVKNFRSITDRELLQDIFDECDNSLYTEFNSPDGYEKVLGMKKKRYDKLLHTEDPSIVTVSEDSIGCCNIHKSK